MITKHVVFEGELPAWVGDAPRLTATGEALSEEVTLTGKDAEAFAAEDVTFFAARRRNAKGKWVLRPPVRPVELTPEEMAAQAEAAFQQALADRREALRAELAEKADPLYFEWQAGEATEEDWREKRLEIKARHPKPERAGQEDREK